MRRNASLLALISMIAAAATPMPAQGRDRGLVEMPDQPLRGGLYLTGGIGDGLEQYRYHDLTGYTDWLSSPAAVLRIGGTPNRNVRVGGELFGWWNSAYNTDLQENTTETFTAALLDAQLYPSPRAGFYVKGGLGFGRSGTSFELERSIGKTGFVWSAGAGYDIPLSRSVSIAPTVDFYQGSFNHAGDPTDSYTERVLNVGASLTFQSGRRHWR
jgi:opacity protein-like surface antigen